MKALWTILGMVLMASSSLSALTISHENASQTSAAFESLAVADAGVVEIVLIALGAVKAEARPDRPMPLQFGLPGAGDGSQVAACRPVWVEFSLLSSQSGGAEVELASPINDLTPARPSLPWRLATQHPIIEVKSKAAQENVPAPTASGLRSVAILGYLGLGR